MSELNELAKHLKVIEVDGSPLKKLKDRYNVQIIKSSIDFNGLADSTLNSTSGSIFADKQKCFFYKNDGLGCFVYYFGDELNSGQD